MLGTQNNFIIHDEQMNPNKRLATRTIAFEIVKSILKDILFLLNAIEHRCTLAIERNWKNIIRINYFCCNGIVDFSDRHLLLELLVFFLLRWM